MNSKSSVVSFDIWGTLFESNPNFKKKREQFIRKTLKDNKFFKSGKFLESIDIFSILEAIKKDIDAVVELYGLSPQPTQLYT
jgi:FMN phosphatase YigB (HAD superfamily)